MADLEVDNAHNGKPAVDRKNTPWYEDELRELSTEARRLLEEYSKIPSDKVVDHVLEVRDRAFDVFPYPCIGGFRFLNLSIMSTPYYSEVLQRIKDGDKFLDVGCCFGQELRQLAFDGAPMGNLYGTDMRLDFMNLGYDLFLDKDTFKAQFVEADIFDDNSALVKQLTGQIDIIYTGSFFHLFDLDEQLKVAKRLVSLLKNQPNVLILGRQVGNINPGIAMTHSKQRQVYRHDIETWTKFWDKVGQETGSKWKVDVSMTPRSKLGVRKKWWADNNGLLLKFALRRE